MKDDKKHYQLCPTCRHKRYDLPKVEDSYELASSDYSFCKEEKRHEEKPQLLSPGSVEWDREFIL